MGEQKEPSEAKGNVIPSEERRTSLYICDLSPTRPDVGWRKYKRNKPPKRY